MKFNLKYSLEIVNKEYINFFIEELTSQSGLPSDIDNLLHNKIKI